jgi:DtxR family Mn-dependent transcriptional regulator
MKISENAQELLENLWILSEEGGSGLESSAAQPPDYSELAALSLVTMAGAVACLTPGGKTEAGMAIRRHRLAERLMVDVFVTEEALIEERACSMEHALFDGVDESICTLLGHPQVCPHGKPIPPGRCCQQMRSTVGRLIAPLNELKSGETGRIAYIKMNDPNRLHKLMAMGVLPGVPLRVLRNRPSYVFEAGYSQFAVDEEIASAIYIRLSSPPE